MEGEYTSPDQSNKLVRQDRYFLATVRTVFSIFFAMLNDVKHQSYDCENNHQYLVNTHRPHLLCEVQIGQGARPPATPLRALWFLQNTT